MPKKMTNRQRLEAFVEKTGLKVVSWEPDEDSVMVETSYEPGVAEVRMNGNHLRASTILPLSAELVSHKLIEDDSFWLIVPAFKV